MSNGSLDKWLYSHNYCLNLFQRVSIIALEYLHDGQSEPVVHCDLKPSNVLLDEDMIAHVADFRIAKTLAENKTTTQTNTLGTLGYIAPEYGSEGRVSTSGDMYSYGIMLLETFTRKKPIDEMCTEERSLKQWVSTWLPDEVMEVVDSGLLRTQNEGDMVATQNNLIAILALGLECSTELVEERIQIKEVLGKLNKIKRQLLKTKVFDRFVFGCAHRRNKQKKSVGKRIFAGFFGCNGPCLDKKSVHVSEAHRKGLKKESLRSVNPVVFDGTKQLESGLRGGENFAFPILDSGEENLTIKKQLDLEEEPRHSIEV
ncbi:hypothetical protein TEA_014537 [Camellia sinensis var. sinensis]|uniref:non-specific serine/threonine protein kinase n=1 Tax=Camellia sinensis var. sinensis TaxID=542762 RepID=A0A4V3WMN0_CAMSN|nr:hypothetical protein TEA_014537 [Camellia sinensis var. sinensis]